MKLEIRKQVQEEISFSEVIQIYKMKNTEIKRTKERFSTGSDIQYELREHSRKQNYRYPVLHEKHEILGTRVV